MKDNPPPRGPLSWFAGFLAVAALALAMWPWPWPKASIHWQVTLILGLVATAGGLLQFNLFGASYTVRRQLLAHSFLLAGLVLLPLKSGGAELPVYARVVSVACILVFFFLTWQLARDKRAAGKETAPPDRYNQ